MLIVRAYTIIKGARLLMQIVTPTITLIAKTEVLFGALAELERDWFDTVMTDDLTPELLIEFAGRECYQSWGKPNSLTSTLDGYIDNLKKQRHFSVLEHVVATFRFQSVSRSLTHELIRHRHFSYSQLSQRYVDGSDLKIVVHPDVSSLLQVERGDPDGFVADHFIDERLDDLTEAVRRFYAEVDNALENKGVPHKRRRGASRGALMNMTATNIVVTGNLRAWRHFILMRCTPHAEIEIRQAAFSVYSQLAKEFPHSFDDITVVDWDEKTVTSELAEVK